MPDDNDAAARFEELARTLPVRTTRAPARKPRLAPWQASVRAARPVASAPESAPASGVQLRGGYLNDERVEFARCLVAVTRGS